MKDENYYRKCVVCFDDRQEVLLKCDRCVYHVCKNCVVKMGKVDMKICRESDCKYDYLNDDEDSHCYICSRRTTDIVFHCPTCTLDRNYKLSDFTDEITTSVTKNKGLKRFSSSNDKFENFYVIYFTVLDLDTGKYDLLSFRTSNSIII